MAKHTEKEEDASAYDAALRRISQDIQSKADQSAGDAAKGGREEKVE